MFARNEKETMEEFKFRKNDFGKSVHP